MIPASILIVLNQIKPNQTKQKQEVNGNIISLSQNNLITSNNNMLYWLPSNKFIQDFHLISETFTKFIWSLLQMNYWFQAV